MLQNINSIEKRFRVIYKVFISSEKPGWKHLNTSQQSAILYFIVKSWCGVFLLAYLSNEISEMLHVF